MGAYYRAPLIALAAFVATWQICALVQAQALHTTDGIWQNVTLSSLDSEGWNFTTRDGQSLRRQNVCRWGSWMGIRAQPAVCLSDGSWICGEVSVQDAGNVSVRNDWVACPNIPAAAVRAIVLNPAPLLSQWLDLQSRLRGLAGNLDTVWLRSNHKLEGIIRWPDKASDLLSLESNGDMMQIRLDEIDALAMSPALVGPVPEKSSGLKLGLKDGSLLHLRDQPTSTLFKAKLTLDAGILLTSHDDPNQFAGAVRYIQQFQSESELLSSQPVASYKHLPEGTLSWDLGTNRDIVNRLLIVQDGIVDYGLAMHSTSQVAFRWDGSAGRLLAELQFAKPQFGADQRLGSVTCQVLLARSGELAQAGQYSISRSGEHPSSAIVDVDVAGAQLIVLVTGADGMGQLGDHVLWLDARVTRR